LKILVDTSAWSLALRRKGTPTHPAAAALGRLIDEDQDICITGPILQEVLQGFRSDSQLRRALSLLAHVPLLPLAREDYVSAARLLGRCASRGIAATTIDCQIAAAAINHGCQLLTADEDFKHIAKVCRLKLL
jgi:predicted nucleic acid-binding protein